MGYTKRLIAEQVLYRLAGGRPDVSFAISRQDLYPAISQKINTILKTQHFSMTMADGERIPENLMIATYNDIPVSTFGGKKAIATLPVMPISLPRNVGVYEVASDAYFQNLYIPLQAGMANLVKGQPVISKLITECAYELYGNSVIFTTDITINNITMVHMRLVILDISQYDEYTSLPIPSDYADGIIEALIKDFAPLVNKPDDAIVTNYEMK